MTEEEEKGLNFKLNLSQLFQGLIILGIAGLFMQFQELKDSTAISVSERQALKEDISELKNEVRYLRNIIYTAVRDKDSLKK